MYTTTEIQRRLVRFAVAGVLLLPLWGFPVGAGATDGRTGDAASRQASMVRATAVAIDARKDTARLTFTLTAGVEAKAFLLERPDRVIVDLPEVNFQLPKNAGRPPAGKGHFIGSFRFGLFAPERSRVVIDLREPALVGRVETVRTATGAELVIELNKATRGAYRKAALRPMVDSGDGLPGQQPDTPKAVTHGPKNEALPLVVIDPGHGGIDPGAQTGDGVLEKDVVFAFAQRLRDMLEASGRYRVMMTRTTDTFIALGARTRVARQAGADLFISIHADTLGSGGGVRGATIYTGSDLATDLESARLADKENLADQIAGVEAAEDPDEIVGILADLTKRETRTFSNSFAGNVIDSFKGTVLLNKNPHRSAGFRVLKAPDVPSVLVELGYLSSAKDAALLVSDEWQKNAANALNEAISRYFSQRSPTEKAGGVAFSP
ncbi:MULTISPECIES: N-acetylmuramoyl-L-alanine amidase [unclassified Chelatococcus]|uniref:N-acetylmuramoyl-L-alanine amidase n=1 Tax=unclassified Chelatococcus TaxID=2638111 RepID=UPI00224BB7D9|nr:N-acetylmuramoyl-L-alanine amidase [Chelatococcus sp.]MCO5076895.1 N-acetylmuramoyl-L-alanine amidase [Chelatococcus sp.]CAH1672331.1 N-acetylmuramoyl-L-alanine amidase [Hyphomicrobiales bacterium]CAH1675434.1 N-acetylmuramoyl-L-alanine amidase [Hyphomicrobiales bacterium]